MERKAYAKVNIFLKITGVRKGYHLLASRFMRVAHLYDTVALKRKQTKRKGFEIEGHFDCATEQNTIYKAFVALKEAVHSEDLERFFDSYKVVVEKHIPAFAGLGGGSSDAAAFLHLCNEHLELGLGVQALADIGMGVGADVPFFVYGYDSANVEGVGEIVTPFEEELLELDVITPNIAISTPAVYKKYRNDFFAPISKKDAQKWLLSPSKEIMETKSRDEANDLFAPASALYPQLREYAKEGWFFSGSGSSFFRS